MKIIMVFFSGEKGFFFRRKGIFLQHLHFGKENPSLKFLLIYLWMICLQTSPGDGLLCMGYKLNWPVFLWRKKNKNKNSIFLAASEQVAMMELLKPVCDDIKMCKVYVWCKNTYNNLTIDGSLSMYILGV